MIKQSILLLFLFVNTWLYACQCPLTALNNDEIKKYDIIFKGTVNKITLNDKRSEALFNVITLFKGDVTQQFKILFDNTDNCKIDLREGDEWIIYTNYIQIDKAKLDFCSRSRYYIKNIKEDFFTEVTGVSYDEELRFLQTTLGEHKLLKENPNKSQNRNQIPNKNQFIIIIIISCVAMVLFYWGFNKLFK